jgi:hypothetical protein
MKVTTNYAQWQATFEKQAKATLQKATRIQQEAAQMLFENIVKRTPVGNPALWNPPIWPRNYTPGQLKASWKIEIMGDTVEISNDQPYAERVENGWSSQAPAGMMKISLLEWNSLLEQASRRVR